MASLTMMGRKIEAEILRGLNFGLVMSDFGLCIAEIRHHKSEIEKY